MRFDRISIVFLCVALGGCAGVAAPEDASMANAMCDQGKNLLASGKTTEARDLYLSATQRDDDNTRAWNGLGAAYELLGQKDAARKAYQRAHDLAPADWGALNNLAHLALAQGDPDTAVDLLQGVAADKNAPPVVRQNLDAALQALQAQRAKDGNNYADLGSYPTQGMAQGHLTEAQALLNDATVIFSIDPEVKVTGGVPVFTLKAKGRSSVDICRDMNAKAFPCVAHGK